MKRIVSFFIAAFAMLAISAGITSCDKDSIAVAKLLGTWKTEKMVVLMTHEGKEISSETITLDKGDNDMFKTLTFISDGNVVATFKDGEVDNGTWEYSDDVLTTTINGEESHYNVVELKASKMVLSQENDINGEKVEMVWTLNKVK